MRLLSALRLSLSLVLLNAGPTSLLAHSTGVEACSRGDGTCTESGRGHTARRRLLLEGWAEAIGVMPPQFIELKPVVDHSPTGAFVPHRRIFAYAGCADRPEWRFVWPTSLTEGFNCDDYAVSGINHDYCDIDIGYDFDVGDWLTAAQGCPVACSSCCDVSTHCDAAQNPAVCRRDCRGTRVFTVGGQPVTVTDPFEKYLAHVDAVAGPPTTLENGVWAAFQQHKLGVNTALSVNRTLHELVPFNGGLFYDEKEFRVFSSTPLSKVAYTLDGSIPSLSEGTSASKIRLEASAVVKAIGYLPVDSRRTMAASNTSLVSVTIKASPPTLRVIECKIGEITLQFNATHPYGNQTCELVKMEIKAQASLGPLANSTRLRYMVNQPDPGSSNPQAQYRALITLVAETSSAQAGADTNRTNAQEGIETVGPTLVSARAWRSGTEPSDAVISALVYLGGGSVKSLGWMGTVGYWKFTRENLAGDYRRAVWRGNGCTERLATYVSPATVLDTLSILGPAVLRGPACKGGVWDLDYDLSPNLTWFLQPTTGDVTPPTGNASDFPRDWTGLRFDSLNTGLYVVDDLSDALASGTFPRGSLTVEAAFTIDIDHRIALGGLVSARVDGVEVSSFRYGKGWSVGYTVDLFSDSISFLFSLAVSAAEIQPGFGGLRDVTAHVPRTSIVQGQLLHLICIYDGKHARIYLNGKLVTQQHMCDTESCGDLMYPADQDMLYTGGRRAGLTLGILDTLGDGRVASHQGTLRLVRILKEALSEEQITAAAVRTLELRQSEIACQPGLYGPYEGLEPCLPCQPGSVSVNRQASVCEKCVMDSYSPSAASVECFLCPLGYHTLAAGSSSCTNDACLLATHDCDPLATCVASNTSEAADFTCLCPRGFPGGGKHGTCQALCGDGILAGDEACDDGNLEVGDGCSDECRVEASYECSLRSSSSSGDGGGGGGVSGSSSGGSVCVCRAEAAQCCALTYNVCLRHVPIATSSSSSSSSSSSATDATAQPGNPSATGADMTRTDMTQAACLAHFVQCVAAAQDLSPNRQTSPDVPLYRSGNSTTYGIGPDQDVSDVTQVPSACDAVQLGRCEELKVKCALSSASEDQCLQLEASCFLAVGCENA